MGGIHQIDEGVQGDSREKRSNGRNLKVRQFNMWGQMQQWYTSEAPHPCWKEGYKEPQRVTMLGVICHLEKFAPAVEPAEQINSIEQVTEKCFSI